MTSHAALSAPRSGADPDLAADWNKIFIDPDNKSRVVMHALLALTLRKEGQSSAALPIHGLTVLAGPPGTGKTTLARGLASVLHQQLKDRLGPVTLVELNPHALTSELHGQTQRAVVSILEEHVPALAQDGPTVLLLDEVEALAVARSAASLESNPADVHRATDAVLAGLDKLARECPKLVIVATTNFEATVDSAFLSRADMVLDVPLPNAKAIASMLCDTLLELAERCSAPKGSPLRAAADPDKLAPLASCLVGRDGRQVRKFVVDVLASDSDLALAPQRLSLQALTAAQRQLSGGQAHAA